MALGSDAIVLAVEKAVVVKMIERRMNLDTIFLPQIQRK